MTIKTILILSKWMKYKRFIWEEEIIMSDFWYHHTWCWFDKVYIDYNWTKFDIVNNYIFNEIRPRLNPWWYIYENMTSFERLRREKRCYVCQEKLDWLKCKTCKTTYTKEFFNL